MKKEKEFRQKNKIVGNFYLFAARNKESIKNIPFSQIPTSFPTLPPPSPSMTNFFMTNFSLTNIYLAIVFLAIISMTIFSLAIILHNSLCLYFLFILFFLHIGFGVCNRQATP